MSTIVKLAAAVMAVYGVISIAGGVIGDVVRAGRASQAWPPSQRVDLGVVLAVCAALDDVSKLLRPANVAIIVAVLPLGRFVPKVITASPAAPPAGVEEDDQAAGAVLAMVIGGGLTVLFACWPWRCGPTHPP